MSKTKKIATQGKVWASRHYLGEETQEETLLEVQTFNTEVATVSASYGLTINLGNYQSARCDAGVTLPTYVEELSEAFTKAWELAEAKVQEQVAAIKKTGV